MNKFPAKKPIAIDLFSGCGGLSLGLKRAGFRVAAAVELDRLACTTFHKNHKTTMLFADDIRSISPEDLLSKAQLKANSIAMIAGCPPCQGFSTLRTKNKGTSIQDNQNELVFEFERFVTFIMPPLFMMENVPRLFGDHRLLSMRRRLEKLGYVCSVELRDAADFGAPQRRKRLILVGALGASPRLARANDRRRTVREAIGRLPPPEASEDPMHNYSVNRAQNVMEIIRRIPKDGGSRSSLSAEYTLRCHDSFDGFSDVYGRMKWSAPSPTITGGCINPSKGRFIHPDQDRAITLREAALLQGFPLSYRFELSRGRYSTAQMIGNAFPPIFAEKHAAALREML